MAFEESPSTSLDHANWRACIIHGMQTAVSRKYNLMKGKRFTESSFAGLGRDVLGFLLFVSLFLELPVASRLVPKPCSVVIQATRIPRLRRVLASVLARR